MSDDAATKKQSDPVAPPWQSAEPHTDWMRQRDIETLVVEDIRTIGYRPSITDVYRRAYYTLLDLGISMAGSSNKLIEDIKARMDLGKKKYGQRLRSFNGRNAEVDMYQEILDAIDYGRQVLEERDERRRVGIRG